MSIADASQKAHPPSALPRGTRLGEFELRHVLGVGGFGIVYLAFDHALEREVAVKEYLPATLVGRTETMHVTLRSQSDADTFALGLKSFVNEARLLAHFDHPSLLKVLRFWEANGTAYMAMPVLRGHTVKEVRLDMKQPPDEAWMRALLDPLLGAIERLHAEGVFHRDIAPDNIQIEPDGRPVLLDFGAARRVISDKTQSLTAILKPAYAPIEQYAEAGSVKQGPWTDLYALGATMHYVLLARPPLPATTRAVHDDLPALSAQELPGCSAEFLNILDWMLAPRPADRPQSVAAVRDVLAGRAPAPRRRTAEPADAGSWERTIVHKPAVAAPAVEVERTYAATMVMPPRDAPAATPPAARPQGAADSPRAPAAGAVDAPRSRLVPILLGVVVVALVGVAVAFGLRPGAATPPQAAASAPELAAVAASAPAVAASVAGTAPLPAPALVAAPVPAAVAASAPAPAPAPAPAAVAAQSIVAKPMPAPVDKKPPPTRLPAAAVPATTTATAPAAAGPAPAPVLQAAPTSPPARAEPVQPARPQAAESTPAAVPLPKAVAAGPEATCAGRNQLAYFVCMERECLRSELGANQHADCRKWRAARPSDSPTF